MMQPTKMEWPNIAVEWINCLELTANPITKIEEISDGRFLCEVLLLLFQKSVDINNKQEIFSQLQQCIRNRYSPKDWIDFQLAKRGHRNELTKILSVIVSISSFQNLEKIFITNPAERLPGDVQVVIRNFLISVLQNDKIVDEDCLSHSENDEPIIGNPHEGHNSVNTLVPRVLFPSNSNRHGRLYPPASPLVFISSPKSSPSPRQCLPHTPLKDLFQSPYIENEVLHNQISTFQVNERILKENLRDLEKDCIQLRDEKNAILNNFESNKKELAILRAKVNDQTLICSLYEDNASTCPTPNVSEIGDIKEQLKKSRQLVDKLETHNFELISAHDDLSNALKTSKLNEKEYGLFIKDLQQELENLAVENDKLRNEKHLGEETINSLENHISELKQIHYASLPHLSFTSQADQGMDDSRNPSSIFSVCEDLGSTVVDVQLKEAKVELKTLLEHVAELCKEKTELCVQISSQRVEIETLNTEFIKKELLSTKLENELAEKNATLIAVQDEGRISNETNQTLEIQLTKLAAERDLALTVVNSQLEDAKLETQTVRDKFAQLSQEKTELLERMTDQKAVMDTLKEEFNKKELLSTKLEKELAENNATLIAVRDEGRISNETIQTLEIQLTKLAAERDLALTVVNSQLEDAKLETQTVRDKFAQLSQEKTELLEGMTDQKAETDTLKEEFNKKELLSTKLEKELAENNATLIAVRDEGRISNETIQTLEIRLTKLAAERDLALTVVNSQLEDAKLETQTVRDKFEQLSQEKTELLERMTDQKAETDTLKEEFNKKELLSTRLEKELAENNATLIAVQDEGRISNETNQTLEIRLTKLAAERDLALAVVNSQLEEAKLATQSVQDKFEQLSQEKTELLEQMTDQKAVMDTLKEEFNKKELLSTKLEKELAENNATLIAVRDEGRISNETIQTLEIQLTKLAAERDLALTVVNSQLEDAKLETQTVRDKFAQLSQEKTELLEGMTDQKAETDTLKEEFNKKELLSTKLEKELAENNATLIAVRDEGRISNETIQTLEIRLTKLAAERDLALTVVNSQLEDAKLETQTVRDKFEQLSQEKTELLERMTDQKAETDTLKEEFNKKELLSTRLEKELAENNATLIAVQDEGRISNETNQTLEIRLTKLAAERDLALAVVNSQLEEAKLATQSVQDKFEQLSQEKTELLEQMTDQKAVMDTLKEEFNKKELLSTKLEKELAENNATLIAVRDEGRISNETIQTLEIQLTKLAAERDLALTVVNSQLEDAKLETQTVRDKFAQLSQEKTELLEGMTDQKAETDTLKEEFNKKELLSRKLEKELAENNDTLIAVQDEGRISNETNQTLEIQLTKLAAECDLALTVVNSQLEDAKLETQTVRDKFAQLSQEKTELLERMTDQKAETDTVKEEFNKKEFLSTKLEKDLAEKNATLIAVQEEGRISNETNQTLEIQLTKLAAERDLALAVVNSQLEEAKLETQSVQDKFAQLSQEKTELIERMTSQKAELDTLKEEFNKKVLLSTKLEIELGQIRDSLITVQDQARVYSATIETQNIHLKQITMDHAVKLKNTKEELKIIYSGRFEETKFRMKLLTRDLESGLASAKSELKAKDVELIELKEQNENQRREKGLLRAECIELNNKIYQLERKILQIEKSATKNVQVAGISSGHGGQFAKKIVITSSVNQNPYNEFSNCSSLSTNSLNLISDRRLSNCSKSSVSSNCSGSSRPKVVPDGSGSLFTCEDEEYNFSEKNKTDMKKGLQQHCCSTISDDRKCPMCKLQRKAELCRRNTMVPAHLRDCYSSEFNDSGIRACDV